MAFNLRSVREFVHLHQYKLGLVVATLIGLTPLCWFKGNFIAGEEYYALNYAQWGKMFGETWFNRVNYGEYSVLLPFKYQALFFSTLNGIGVGNYTAQIIWHTGLFLAAAIGFYLVCYLILKNKFPVVFYIFATTYYVFSAYFLNISPLLSPARILFAFMPIVFYLCYLTLTYPDKSYFYAVMLNFCLLLMSPIFVNIPQGIALLSLIVLLYAIAGLGWQRFLTTVLLFTCLFVLLNAWWIIPTGYKQLSGLENLRSEAATFSVVDRSKTSDVLTLFGSWAFREKIFNTPYYYFSYNEWFDSFVGVVVRIVPVLLIVFGLVNLYTNPKKFAGIANWVKFVTVVYLLYLFLSKGTNEPFGLIYQVLYNYLPTFWMYREPYAKFAPIATFASAFLLIFGVDCVLNLTKKYTDAKYHAQVIVVLIIGLILSAFARFYVNGEIFFTVNDSINRSNYVKIPAGWEQLSASWQPQPGYYFLYPPGNMYNYYNWPSGYVGNPFLLLTDAHILNPTSGYSDSENRQRHIAINFLMKNIVEAPENYMDMCRKFNLGGIVLQKDLVDNNNYGDTTLNLSKKLEKFKTFDNANVTVYDCPNYSYAKVSLITPKSLVKLSPTDINKYHFLKPTTGDNNTFIITEGTDTDLHLAQPDLADKINSITYSFDFEQQKNTKYLLLGNLDNVQSVTFDEQPTRLTPYKNYLIIEPTNEQICCKALKITTKAPIITTESQKNPWFRSSSQKIALEQQLDAADEKIKLNREEVYLTKLDNFDPSKDFRIQVGLRNATSNVPFGISLVQIDAKTKASRFFVNAQVLDLRTQGVLDYQGSTANFINFFGQSEYYLAIYGLNLKGSYPPDTYLVPGEMQVTNLHFPVAFALNFDASATDLDASLDDYVERGSSLVMFKIKSPVNSKAVVHFKNSYDPHWKLLNIDTKGYEETKNNYRSLSKKIQMLTKAQNAPSPVNLEYYSNGWEIDPNNSTNFALVFWPTLLADVLFELCTALTVALALRTLLVWRKKWLV
jgi:hypothetical protein